MNIERPAGDEPTHALLDRIAALQEIQKRNPTISAEWEAASKELAPLFLEMAKRFPNAPLGAAIAEMYLGPLELPDGTSVEDGGSLTPVLAIASVEDGDDFWGAPISVYTRAQAIDDGMLIDVTERAKVHGIKLHTVLTAGAWTECVAWAEDDNKRKGTAQDETGRLLDVLAMAAWRMRAAARDDGENRATFSVLRTPREGRGQKARAVELVVHVGPGDRAEPVLTIMLPGED